MLKFHLYEKLTLYAAIFQSKVIDVRVKIKINRTITQKKKKPQVSLLLLFEGLKYIEV